MKTRATIKEALEWTRKGLINGSDAEWVKEQVGVKNKRPKYNNQKVIYDGKTFDSKKEYNRYRELLLLLKSGEIGFLNCQEEFELIPKTETTRKVIYKADFTYIITKTGEKVIEDVKSIITRKNRVYINKKKQMKAIYNIDIKEV